MVSAAVLSNSDLLHGSARAMPTSSPSGVSLPWKRATLRPTCARLRRWPGSPPSERDGTLARCLATLRPLLKIVVSPVRFRASPFLRSPATEGFLHGRARPRADLRACREAEFHCPCRFASTRPSSFATLSAEYAADLGKRASLKRAEPQPDPADIATADLKRPELSNVELATRNELVGPSIRTAGPRTTQSTNRSARKVPDSPSGSRGMPSTSRSPPAWSRRAIRG